MPNTATTATAIYRYPVKGLSAEKLDRVTLTPGECLPHDRRFAIALGKYISLINRASIAALQHAMGVPVDPIRFRANVYFDGAAAWSEHD
jgi:MOSC domain-containing protein